MTPKDTLLFLLFLGAGFTAGYGGAVFVRWLYRRRPPPDRSRSAAGTGLTIALWPITFNLAMAGIQALRHNADTALTHLVVAAFFLALYLGIWLGTKHGERRKSES